MKSPLWLSRKGGGEEESSVGGLGREATVMEVGEAV